MWLSLMAVFMSLVSLQWVIWDSPEKATLAKMKTILLSWCASDCPNKSRQTHSNRAKEIAFHVFHNNFAHRLSVHFQKGRQNPQRVLILNLFRFFIQISASKGYKSGQNYFWACVSVYETSVVIHLPESRKKNWPFKISSLKKRINNFLNYIIWTAWSSQICLCV